MNHQVSHYHRIRYCIGHRRTALCKLEGSIMVNDNRVCFQKHHGAVFIRDGVVIRDNMAYKEF